MNNFPNFQTNEEEILFYEIFEENLTTYKYILDKVKDELYGKGTGNYANLPGSCFQIVYSITNDLIGESIRKYKEIKHPPDAPESSLQFTLGDK